MVIAGVIAEYNPFHKGHRYQLDRIRELTGADYIIAAMSGDFVQRGTPAIFDKYTRTEMALSCGADMVLELPCACAVSSAETFARGGLLLLKEAGITHLAFGAECPSLPALQALAAVFDTEPQEYRESLRNGLRQGLSYPAARSLAAADFIAKNSSASTCTSGLEETDGLSKDEPIRKTAFLTTQDVTAILKEPNNILAIEYLKAIRRFAPQIIPVLIPRIGESYHSEHVSDNEETFSSATAIRNFLFSHDTASISSTGTDLPSSDGSALPSSDGSALSSSTGTDLSSSAGSGLLFTSVPEETADFYRRALTAGRIVRPQALDSMMGYCLFTEDDYGKYADLPSDLANRIRQMKGEYRGFESFSQVLCTRNFTQAAVRRALLHILLSITEDELRTVRSEAVYLRILGFRKSSAPLLSMILKASTVPLIHSLPGYLKGQGTNSEAAQSQPDSDKYTALRRREILCTDIKASDLYRLLVLSSGGQPRKRDISQPLIIL